MPLFDKTQQNWCTYEQELFAVLTGLRKYKEILFGYPITVETDHANLRYLHKSVVPKVVRWRMELQGLGDINFKYIPGKDNIMADLLSRRTAECHAGRAVQADRQAEQQAERLLYEKTEEAMRKHGRCNVCFMNTDRAVYVYSVQQARVQENVVSHLTMLQNSIKNNNVRDMLVHLDYIHSKLNQASPESIDSLIKLVAECFPSRIMFPDQLLNSRVREKYTHIEPVISDWRDQLKGGTISFEDIKIAMSESSRRKRRQRARSVDDAELPPPKKRRLGKRSKAVATVADSLDANQSDPSATGGQTTYDRQKYNNTMTVPKRSLKEVTGSEDPGKDCKTRSGGTYEDANGVQYLLEDFEMLDEEGVANHLRSLRQDDRRVSEQRIRKYCLYILHDMKGHQAPNQMISDMRAVGLSWRGQVEEAKAHVSACIKCQKYKTFKKTRVGSLLGYVVSEPNKVVEMDFCGPFPSSSAGNKHILVIVDKFSRYTMLSTCASVSSQEAANGLAKWIFRFGIPNVVVSDNAMSFHAKVEKALCAIFGVDQRFHAPHHHRAAGLVERRIRTVQEILKTVMTSLTEWDKEIEMIEHLVNFQGMKVLGGLPPVAVMMNVAGVSIPDRITQVLALATGNGKNMVNLSGEGVGSLVDSKDLTVRNYIDELKERASRIQGVVLSATRECQAANAKSWSKNRMTSELRTFAIGDLVLLHMTRANDNLKSAWRGPLVVMDAEGPGDHPGVQPVYRLLDPLGKGRNRYLKAHCERIVPFNAANLNCWSDIVDVNANDGGMDYDVKEIVDHVVEEETGNIWFRTRWSSAPVESKDTWQDLSSFSSRCSRVQEYAKKHPEVQEYLDAAAE